MNWRIAFIGLVLYSSPAQACRLALALALDVSSSISPEEDQQQRLGLAGALLDPDVIAAFLVPRDPVALHVFEWSGRYDQEPILPDWRVIKSEQDLREVALSIAQSPRSRSDMPTAMGHALGYGALLFESRMDCLFKTIDVSGDGPNNDGFSPALAYGAFPFTNITVNALVVATDDAAPDALIAYFEEEVLRGPGAFVEVADGFSDYSAAIRRKLLRELEVRVIGAHPLFAPPNG